MMEDLEETINHTITRKVFRNSEQDISNDFYDFNPKTSNYKCYGCQIIKPQQKSVQIIKGQQKKKKRILDSYKMNDIIIKPWHPFLREFQKIFKNSITSKYAELNYQLEYHKPDYVIQIYEIIRRLRDQLLENVKILQQANLSTTQTLETLATYSIDEMEINLESMNNSNKSFQFQQESTKKSLANSSLKYIVQEKKVQHYKDQLEIVQEQVQLLEQNGQISLKQQIQATIKSQKDQQYLRSLLKEAEDHLLILQRENEILLKENYFLYQYAQLDRHYLYIQIMKQYPADLLKETDASMFDIYLQEMEKELAKLRLENTKLMVMSKNYEKESQVIKQESETIYSKEFKQQEIRWNAEKNKYEHTINQLKRELESALAAEKELKQIARTIQEDKEKLQKQLNDCQNGMNNVCQQLLFNKQQNEQLTRQNLEFQQTIQYLEAQVTNINTQFSKMNPTEQSKQLALIILSRERPNQEQIGILKQVFGEYADEIIQNQLDQSFNEQTEKLIEQIQDLRNFKDKLEQQNRLQLKQIEEIKKEIEFSLQIKEQQVQKTAKQLNFDQDSNTYQQSLLRISEILNIKEEDFQKLSRLRSQAQLNKFDQSNQAYLLLLQALTLEELIGKKDELENFSDYTNGSKDNNQQNNLQQEFIAIDEQDIEESSNQDLDEDIEENHNHQPEPYQAEDYQKK